MNVIAFEQVLVHHGMSSKAAVHLTVAASFACAAALDSLVTGYECDDI